VRITLDGTPLLGTRTGIGRYVAQLLAALPAVLDKELPGSRLGVTTWSARAHRIADLPVGVRQVGPRVPARALRELWTRTSFPPIEALVGRTDVFHGTNFVCPPARHAREVVTIHDLTYLHLAQTVSTDSLRYRTLVPRALDRGAHVVTPSAAVAEQAREAYGLPAERVTVTPLGVDPSWSRAVPPSPELRERLRLPSDFIVFVGSLDPRKNLPALLEAHSSVRAQHPDAPALVLAGPAGREPVLARRDGVVTTGWLSDDDLRAVVAGARLVVLPSLDEGFGLPVLEALAAGRPVVASDLPVLREVAGALAHYASPHDPGQIAAALVAALEAPDGPDERAARRTHAAAFTWEACARATVEAYRRAAA
jgi:glycosyltransferase involved in cell wall biosynthesis